MYKDMTLSHWAGSQINLMSIDTLPMQKETHAPGSQPRGRQGDAYIRSVPTLEPTRS